MTSSSCAVGLRYSLWPPAGRPGGRAGEGACFLWAYGGGRSPGPGPPTGRRPWPRRASGRAACSTTETSCSVQERETSSGQSESSSARRRPAESGCRGCWLLLPCLLVCVCVCVCGSQGAPKMYVIKCMVLLHSLKIGSPRDTFWSSPHGSTSSSLRVCVCVCVVPRTPQKCM